MKQAAVALVTGGSRGIGAASVRLLANNGYQVCANFRSDEVAANQIASEYPDGNVIAVRADISKESEVLRLFKEVDERLGTITALVNNAGIVRQQMRVEDMSGDGGSIVNISSAASRVGGAEEYVDYAASKGAIDTLTKGLSLEVAGDGIRVNCVRPGFIYTEMHASGGEPGRVDRLADSIPMKRGGQPIEIANALMWLLSEEASYVTGTFIDASGGR